VKIVGHGVSIELPNGWEARIRRRDGAGPVMHVATFPLRDGDGDFGAAATGRMRDGDSFAALLEYRDGDKIRPGVGLYAASGPPLPRVHEFGPMQLQVTRRGQLGWQRFFTGAGRTCCIYAVVQPGAKPVGGPVAELRGVLATLRLTPPTA
jgi:hypothetical protein